MVGSRVHFTERLPTKRMAADCLFTNEAGHLLVIKPTYKPTWDIPGGAVEHDESPRRAAQREVHEELGLVIEPGRLLAVDWLARAGDFTEVVAFLFDGGVLTSADINQLAPHPTEATALDFVPLDEAERLLDAELFARVRAAVDAQHTAAATYLENGVVPPHTT